MTPHSARRQQDDWPTVEEADCLRRSREAGAKTFCLVGLAFAAALMVAHIMGVGL